MENKYGILVNQNAKLFRRYFKEMVELLGIQTKYRSPLHGGSYTLQGEYWANNYTDPVTVGCIFQEHEDQQTAKKLGWNSELVENAAIIHVPFDLEGLCVGCLFEIPSAFNQDEYRLFRVTKLSAKMIYPASISCEIVPEYIDTMAKEETEVFKTSNFNLLYNEDEG